MITVYRSKPTKLGEEYDDHKYDDNVIYGRKKAKAEEGYKVEPEHNEYKPRGKELKEPVQESTRVNDQFYRPRRSNITRGNKSNFPYAFAFLTGSYRHPNI